MMFMGARYTSQKCQPDKCPHQFTGCRFVYAEMLLKVRAQGKGHFMSAEMLLPNRPSHPLQGASSTPQKCHKCRHPQPITWCRTRSAEMPTCRRTIGGEPILAHRNVTRRTLSPTNHRGPNISRRNAPMASPPPNLGHTSSAAMSG